MLVTLIFAILVGIRKSCQEVCAQSVVGQTVQGALNVVRPKANTSASRHEHSAEPPAFRDNGLLVSNERPVHAVFADSSALYTVATRTISWSSSSGFSYSARVYYPVIDPTKEMSFPIVVYSHGLGSSPDNFAYLGFYWAGRGVVTICIRHPESDESIWRGKIRAMNELKEAYQLHWSARDRARSMRSCIDVVCSGQLGYGPLGFLKARLDTDSIGVAGNDLGALGALLLAGQLPPDNGTYLKDSRVSAALALSPPVFCGALQGSNVYGRIQAPTMIVTGTQDDGIVGSTKAFQRRIPYDSLTGVDRYLVVLQGGDHRVYSGRKMGVKQVNDRAYQETIAKASADFWSAYLLKDETVLTQMSSYGKASVLSNANVEWMLGSPSTK